MQIFLHSIHGLTRRLQEMARKNKKGNRAKDSASSELDSFLSRFGATKIRSGEKHSKGENAVKAELGHKEITINFGKRVADEAVLDQLRHVLNSDFPGDWQISTLK